jgi:hypothetical protein
MARSKSTRAPRAQSRSVSDSQLSRLITAAQGEQSFLPVDREEYSQLAAALAELQARRAADAAPALVVSPAAKFVVLRDGKPFAEHRRELSAKEHRDYQIATADGHEYTVVPASEVRT